MLRMIAHPKRRQIQPHRWHPHSPVRPQDNLLSCLFTELPGHCRSSESLMTHQADVATLTGMSGSASCSSSGQCSGTTESGHTVRNVSPHLSSLPLLTPSLNWPRALTQVS